MRTGRYHADSNPTLTLSILLHIRQETLKLWEQDVCHTLEMFRSADNIQSPSAICMRKPHGQQPNVRQNITSKLKQHSTCYHFQLCTTCGNRLAMPLACVRTSKGEGCMFGIHYSHLREVSRGAHHDRHVATCNILTFKRRMF